MSVENNTVSWEDFNNPKILKYKKLINKMNDLDRRMEFFPTVDSYLMDLLVIYKDGLATGIHSFTLSQFREKMKNEGALRRFDNRKIKL